MRQGQQNRRGRGRNRKNQNPLTRSFESNGPDIKIRGTPAHVAEKYMSMARDAMTNDPVLAENYLQHAEHYNRIILTFREQQSQPNNDGQNAGQNNGNGAARKSDPDAEALDAQADEEDAKYQVVDDGLSQGDQDRGQPHNQRGASGRGDQPRGNNRQRRGRNQNNNNNNTGGNEGRNRQPQAAQQDAGGTGGGHANGNGESRPRRPRTEPTFADADEQPEFLRRPVRRSRRAATSENTEQPKSDSPAVAEESPE